MTTRQLRRMFWVVIGLVGGCDPNPNGPSAPSPVPQGSSQDAAPAPGAPKRVPLKQVGPPIGLLVPLPVAR